MHELYYNGFRQTVQAQELNEILWRMGYENWASLTALQVGQAMHHAHAEHCYLCQETVLDNSGGHSVECPLETHHFYGSQCERCIPDGQWALVNLFERGVVDLRVSGTPTEKAKEMQFERESADLLDPGHSRYAKAGARK
jgi:hypothetical protein